MTATLLLTLIFKYIYIFKLSTPPHTSSMTSSKIMLEHDDIGGDGDVGNDWSDELVAVAAVVGRTRSWR